MTSTLEDATYGYTYEESDLSAIPTRIRYGSRGRPSLNPHREILAQVAGTESVRSFLVPDPGTDEDRAKVLNRHLRWLRSGAHENDRSVRVGHVVLEDEGKIRISFQDRDYERKNRPADNGGEGKEEDDTEE